VPSTSHTACGRSRRRYWAPIDTPLFFLLFRNIALGNWGRGWRNATHTYGCLLMVAWPVRRAPPQPTGASALGPCPRPLPSASGRRARSGLNPGDRGRHLGRTQGRSAGCECHSRSHRVEIQILSIVGRTTAASSNNFLPPTEKICHFLKLEREALDTRSGMVRDIC
jgi:hypothetical protein